MMATSWPSPIASPSFTLISLIVPALGDSTGISIFIDSRIMISPSSSTLSPGLSWIFQTLPAISDFTLTTAMPRTSLAICLGFVGQRARQGKGSSADARAHPVCALIDCGNRSVLQSGAAVADARRKGGDRDASDSFLFQHNE